MGGSVLHLYSQAWNIGGPFGRMGPWVTPLQDLSLSVQLFLCFCVPSASACLENLLLLS